MLGGRISLSTLIITHLLSYNLVLVRKKTKYEEDDRKVKKRKREDYVEKGIPTISKSKTGVRWLISYLFSVYADVFLVKLHTAQHVMYVFPSLLKKPYLLISFFFLFSPYLQHRFYFLTRVFSENPSVFHFANLKKFEILQKKLKNLFKK